MHRKKIVVLGGYGQAGRSSVRLLLERTDAFVVIAGRGLERAQALANLLGKTGTGERVTASYADAARPASLAKAFQGADLVIVTSTTASYTANVVGACLDAHCDYFDILDAPDVVEILNRFAQQAEKGGQLLVTQGGLAPGMAATVVRLAHASFDRLRGARLGLALSLKTAERFEQVMVRKFPFLSGIRMTHGWGGRIGITLDFLPSVGCTGKHGNVHYSAGYNGAGLAFAQLAGQMIAARMADEKSELTENLLNDRTLLGVPSAFLTYIGCNAYKGFFWFNDRILSARH
jgi:NAD(P)-dependent dehydrogenase (short-subunit alcohol dehydrogenase family)